MAAPLVCPACGADGAKDERFCARCGSPLVLVERGSPGDERDERRIRARKVHPPFTEGELVRVAAARHLAEAELIQGLLLEAGVPSLLRRTRGFDVPDFLAAGPRDVLVPAAGAEAAREMLRIPEGGRPRIPRPATRPPWVRALAAAIAVLVIALLAAAVWAAVIS